MKQSDIMETIATSIEDKFFKEWKHEGFIGGCSSEHVNFEVDEKEYVLLIREIGDGEHYSEMKVKRECTHNGF